MIVMMKNVSDFALLKTQTIFSAMMMTDNLK